MPIKEILAWLKRQLSGPVEAAPSREREKDPGLLAAERQTGRSLQIPLEDEEFLRSQGLLGLADTLATLFGSPARIQGTDLTRDWNIQPDPSGNIIYGSYSPLSGEILLDTAFATDPGFKRNVLMHEMAHRGEDPGSGSTQAVARAYQTAYAPVTKLNFKTREWERVEPPPMDKPLTPRQSENWAAAAAEILEDILTGTAVQYPPHGRNLDSPTMVPTSEDRIEFEDDKYLRKRFLMSPILQGLRRKP